MTGGPEHWDRVFGARHEADLTWFEADPEVSLRLVTAHAGPGEPVLDVGGGVSRLVDALLARGYRDLSVLDISVAALAATRDRLGSLARDVRWIEADVTRWRPDRAWALWHDRAVFHFLTERSARAAYLAAMADALPRGSRGGRPMTSRSSSSSMKLSAWRRRSSAIIGGLDRIVETTETRTPCAAGLDQRLEVAVAREQHDVIDRRRQFHGIDRQLDVHVALDLPAALAVGVFLGGLGHHREAVVVQPVDQRPDRRVFLALEQRGVVEGAQQLAAAHEFLRSSL
jgi:SAM-dependent methyltransferase